MTLWNEEQLELLKKLKRDLQQQEHAQQSLARASETVSSRRGFQVDDLFDRLASQQEGIQYRISEEWVPAPLGQLDALLFRLAVNIGIGPPRMAIGLPRVPVGISTWLAVSVMISRVASSRTSPSLDSPVTKSHSRWILIACRERSLRDLYLSQRILFTGRSFLINSFPIYRFRRDGGVMLISFAQPNRLSTPVLFYHFDNIDFAQSEVNEAGVALILAEVSETDSRLSRTMLERLEDVRTFAREPKTIVFFNSFDKSLREYLTSRGYEVVDIRPRIPVNEQVPALPTALGIFSHYYCTQQVTLEVVPDGAGISQVLLDCARDLASVNREIQSDECRAVLTKWWSTWRSLKDLAIPMDTYERYRMHAQGRGSMETAIDRISASADRIVIPEGKVLRAVAPAIRSRLRTIYSKLADACPKAERFMSLLNISISSNDKSVLFVLSEKSQVQALREQALFTNAQLLESEVSIIHLARAVSMARSMVLNKCVVPGIWAPWQNSILLAVGASNVMILMYPYEANLVGTRIQEHFEECTKLSTSTIENEPYSPILALSSQQTYILEALKELSKEQETAIPPPWLNTEPQFAFDSSEEEDKAIEEDLTGEGLLIKFDDGTSVVVRPHSEMMLVTEEGVETVFADVLSEGDVVAVMRDAATRSIFQSVLEQVNHLVKVDTKVVDLWRASIKEVLFEDRPEGASKSVSSIIRSLRKLGCYRTDPTIRQWFKGITLAPLDMQDIQRVLELAGVTRSIDIAKVVTREMNIIRQFNRDLGRHIKGQIRASLTKEKQPMGTRLDFEINEAIEAIDYKTIVLKELIQRG